MHTSFSKFKICKLDKLKFFGCSEWSVMIPSPVYRTDPEEKKGEGGGFQNVSTHRATKMGSVRTHHFGTQNLDRTKTVSEQTACMGSMQAAKWVVLYVPRKRKKERHY
jgi:hypothetical protein